jgi:predicted transcriptional regulator
LRKIFRILIIIKLFSNLIIDMKKLTQEEKEENIRLYNKNINSKDIISKFNIPVSTYYYIIKCYNNQNSNKKLHNITNNLLNDTKFNSKNIINDLKSLISINNIIIIIKF